jgi:hypothetical protein
MTMTNLDERRAQWIADLRSGEYPQGKGALLIVSGEDRKYCCLGVCATRAVPEWVQKKIVLPYGGGYFGEESDEHPYEVIQEYLGITEKQINYLMSMNDGTAIFSSFHKMMRRPVKRKFPQIARFAEVVFALEKITNAG